VSMTNSTDRAEIITSVQRRRRWTAPEKVRMVEETLEPGIPAATTAITSLMTMLCKRGDLSILT